jgi:hypothetical protein
MKVRDIGEKLKHVGGAFISGFGPSLILGMFRGYLDETTVDMCCESILHNQSLWQGLTEDDWFYYAGIVKEYKIDEIKYEDIVKELTKNRIDLMGVIINTPGGEAWLQAQVQFVKSKLWP